MLPRVEQPRLERGESVRCDKMPIVDGRYETRLSTTFSSVDEGIELLTGLPAGKLTDTGEFEEGSLNALILARLKRFGELLRAEGGEEEPGASPRRRRRKQDEEQA